MREIPIILNNLNNNLNMKKFVLLTLMLLVLVSCKDETSSDVNDIDNLNIETETNDNSFAKEIIDNFPIERSSVIGFENFSEGRGNGPSFKAKFAFKNNTKEVITKFELKYFIESKYKDGSFYYFPTAHFNYRDKRDLNHFEQEYEVWKINLQKGEKWNPNEEKIFEIRVPGHYNGGNFSNDLFERTPDSLIFVYQYKAISVDNEYKHVIATDVLDYWKTYQEKLNLR